MLKIEKFANEIINKLKLFNPQLIQLKEDKSEFYIEFTVEQQVLFFYLKKMNGKSKVLFNAGYKKELLYCSFHYLEEEEVGRVFSHFNQFKDYFLFTLNRVLSNYQQVIENGKKAEIILNFIKKQEQEMNDKLKFLQTIKTLSVVKIPIELMTEEVINAINDAYQDKYGNKL